MTTMNPLGRGALARRWLSTAMLALLAACGGSGGDEADPLPATVNLAVPSGHQAVGTAVAFSSDASGSYRYAWDFGDGSTSDQATPSHTYARGGVFNVTLTLRSEDGNSTTGSTTVSVTDAAVVRGQVCSGAAESGWCWQRPLPQGESIAETVYVDNRIGYAFGAKGLILKTSDAGATWVRQVSGTKADLARAVFTDAQAGWVAGGNGEILKTGDGGATWERFSFGRTEFVTAIGAIDANRAWVTTTGVATYVTSDGGRQWKAVVPSDPPYRQAAFSELEVWSLGATATASPVPTASRTVNGGASWSDVALPPLAAGVFSSTPDVLPGGPGLALLARTESGVDANSNFFQREALFITADGGATWQPVANPPAALFQASYVLADAVTIYALQSWGQALYRTSDRGATWQAVPVPSGLSFGFDRPLRAFGPNRLLLTDAAGQSYLSVDGGATWTSSNAVGPGGSDFASVWFFDAREGAAWMWDGSGVRTTDGGQSWTPFASQTFFGLRRVQFLADGSVGWMQSNFGAIHRSTDHGRVWVAPAGATYPLQGVEDFHFIDAMRGWAVSPYGDAGQSALWLTGDGGTTWTLPPTAKAGPGFVSLRFADATHGIAVGPAGVALLSSDGGLTWSPRPTGVASNLRRVTFVDATTAIAVGDFGAIVRSTDRGATWSIVSGPVTASLYDVRFVSASVGHAVGDQGTVLHTRDGGLTWASADTATWRTLLSVFFVDAMTGWVSGAAGAILATATGGR